MNQRHGFDLPALSRNDVIKSHQEHVLVESDPDHIISLLSSDSTCSLDPVNERVLANTLLRLLNDVTRITTPYLQKKISQIEQLINLLPKLMFVEVNGTTPLQQVLKGVDLYFLDLFKSSAERANLLEQYDIELGQTMFDPTDYHLSPVFKALKSKFDLANYTDTDVSIWQEEQHIRYQNDLQSYCKTVYGAAQQKFERCLFDDAVNFANNKHNFDNSIPAQSYLVAGQDSAVYDLLNANSEKKLGVDFCIDVQADGKMFAVSEICVEEINQSETNMWIKFYRDRQIMMVQRASEARKRNEVKCDEQQKREQAELARKKLVSDNDMRQRTKQYQLSKRSILSSRCLGDLSALSNDVFANYLAPMLVECDLEDAINLITAVPLSFLYPIFERELAKKLYQLLNDITNITTPNLLIKMKQIEHLIDLYPSLIFVTVNETTPLRHVFQGIDLYYYWLFESAAERLNKLDQYDNELALQALINITDTVSPVFFELQSKFNTATYHAGAIATWPIDVTTKYLQELELYCKTTYGSAQAKFPRCLYDDMMHAFDIIQLEGNNMFANYSYERCIPPKNYKAYTREGLRRLNRYNFLAPNNEKKLGIDYCLYVGCDGDDDAKLEVVTSLSAEPTNEIIANFQQRIWMCFFNERKQARNKIVEDVTERKRMRDEAESNKTIQVETSAMMSINN